MRSNEVFVGNLSLFCIQAEGEFSMVLLKTCIFTGNTENL